MAEGSDIGEIKMAAIAPDSSVADALVAEVLTAAPAVGTPDGSAGDALVADVLGAAPDAAAPIAHAASERALAAMRSDDAVLEIVLCGASRTRCATGFARERR